MKTFHTFDNLIIGTCEFCKVFALLILFLIAFFTVAVSLLLTYLISVAFIWSIVIVILFFCLFLFCFVLFAFLLYPFSLVSDINNIRYSTLFVIAYDNIWKNDSIRDSNTEKKKKIFEIIWYPWFICQMFMLYFWKDNLLYNRFITFQNKAALGLYWNMTRKCIVSIPKYCT